MKLLEYIFMFLIFGVVGCKEASLTEESVTLEEGREINQPIEFSNWMPTPEHTNINSSDFGMNLNDAVKILGSWDKVGDMIVDEGGQYYPFTNREGYDYIVQITEDGSINSVWKRRTPSLLQSILNNAKNAR